MKIYGTLKELVGTWFRKDTYNVKLTPNAGTYTADTTVSLPPKLSGSDVLIAETTSQTLTNKTISGASNTITNVPISTGISGLGTNVASFLATPSSANLAAALTDETGTGAAVFATSPTLTTPTLSGNTTAGTINSTTIPTSATLTKTSDNLSVFSSTTSSQLAGVISDETGSGALVFANSPTLTTPTLGVASSTSETITGTGGAGFVAVTEQSSAPSTPASGLVRVYAKTDKKLYTKDSAGTEQQVGASGSGEINAITTGSTDATGWLAGTSHSVATDTSNSPLSPIVTTSVAITATATATESSTSGGYKTLTLPTGLQNKKLKVEFYVTTAASQTWSLSMYKGSTRVPLTTDASSVSSLPTGTTGKYTAYFDADNTSGWTYALTRTAGSGTTTAYVTQVIVGPGIQPQGAVVGPWLSYTPTYSAGFGTVSTQATEYRRVGETIELRGRFTTGTVAASVASITIPSGFTIVSPSNIAYIVGEAAASGGTSEFWVTSDTSSDTGKLFFVVQAASNFTSASNGTIFNSTVAVSWKAAIRVNELVGSGTVNLAQNDVEYAYNSSTSTSADDTTSFAYGPSGAQIQSITSGLARRVRFQRPIQNGDTFAVEVSTDQQKWVEVVGAANPNNGGQWVVDWRRQGSSTYGIGQIGIVNSTDVNVYFGTYSTEPTSGTAYAAAGTAWSSGANAFYWRVRKSSAGAAVGFGIVSATSSGLMPSTNSNLDDATATRLGLKQYLHGTSYNGGNAPTVSNSQAGFTMTGGRGVFIPYQLQDGTWRMRLNISFSYTSVNTTNINSTTINGITFQTSVSQALSGATSAGTGNVGINCWTNNNTNTISYYHSTSYTNDRAFISGDVELASKPTWAY